MSNNLEIEKKAMAVSMLAEGNSIRSIERITGIHRDTIMRLGLRVGEGCRQIMDSKMRGLTCKQIECDEIWGFIGAKRKNAVRVSTGARACSDPGAFLFQLPGCWDELLPGVGGQQRWERLGGLSCGELKRESFVGRYFLRRGVGQLRTIIQIRPDINRGEKTMDFELPEPAQLVGRIHAQQDHHVCALAGGVLSHLPHGIVGIMPGQVIVKRCPADPPAVRRWK
jgi:hypothetical protein